MLSKKRRKKSKVKQWKIRALTTRDWTSKEWNSLPLTKQLYVRSLRVLSSGSLKELFTKDFWDDLSGMECKSLGEWFFFFKYKIFWIVVLDDYYCV